VVEVLPTTVRSRPANVLVVISSFKVCVSVKHYGDLVEVWVMLFPDIVSDGGVIRVKKPGAVDILGPDKSGMPGSKNVVGFVVRSLFCMSVKKLKWE
jgi:hypothetical protein